MWWLWCLLLASLLVLACGGETPQSTPAEAARSEEPSIEAAVAPSPTTPPPTDPYCRLGDVAVEVSGRSTGRGVEIRLDAKSNRPCEYRDWVPVHVTEPNGRALAVERNGLRYTVRSLLPAQDPVAILHWDNWCGDSSSPAEILITYQERDTTAVAPHPPCRDATKPSKLVPGVSPAAITPPPPPSLSELPRADFPTMGLVRIRVQKHTTVADGTRCIELVPFMMPPGWRLADRASEIVECIATGVERTRLLMAEDADGSLWVEYVQILAPATIQLPVPNRDPECVAAEESFIRATESPDTAVWTTVCWELVHGRAAPAPSTYEQVWILLPETSETRAVPHGGVCWHYSRFFTTSTESPTIPIRCGMEFGVLAGAP